MATAEEVGALVGKEFLPLCDEMTTSDLQGCIVAAVSKHGLSPADEDKAVEIALEYIYAQQASAEPTHD
jgi:hypothetical protein